LGKGVRRRHAFIYPGRSTFGIAMAVTDGKEVTAIAANSISTDQARGFLDLFHPDTLVYTTEHIVENPRAIPISSSATPRVAKSGWFERKIPNIIMDQVGRYGNYAYRIAINELAIKGEYAMGSAGLKPLTSEWLEAHSPPRILR